MRWPRLSTATSTSRSSMRSRRSPGTTTYL
jgi:hypothetical protein